MKNFIKLFSQKIFRKTDTLEKEIKIHSTEISDEQDTILEETQTSTETLEVANKMRMTVSGLPSELEKSEREKICKSLVHHSLTNANDRRYSNGERIHQGNAEIKIHEESYRISYALDATNVITALKIYKEAFDIVNTGAKTGIYDEELAKMTSDYLKESAWQEVESFENRNNQ